MVAIRRLARLQATAAANMVSALREGDRLKADLALSKVDDAPRFDTGAAMPIFAADDLISGYDAHLSLLNRDWSIIGRNDQKPPVGDWRTWLVMGGRGSGKTRAGAEWVHALASGAGDRSDMRIALVAETLGDAREVMIDGVSGICRVARSKRPDFEISRRRLVWPNGAVAQIFSSEDPESLRGPQFHYAWCDELHCSIANACVNPAFIAFIERFQSIKR